MFVMLEIQRSPQSFMAKAFLAFAIVISLFLGIFFAFVGYMKAFAPIPELAAHGAWTVHLPSALGRLIGWSEIACAVLLLTCQWKARTRKYWAAGAAILFANQIAAAAVHSAQSELQALPQNAGIIAGCIVIVLAANKLQKQ